MMIQFQRAQSTPVLVKGGTYDGWTADALAAPGCCWDGTRFVMTVSMWSIANSQWASAFFTSTDLRTWTYVTGSLLTPSGGDYIIGNSGLAWFQGLYYFAYNHYPVVGNPQVALATSSDLISWTLIGDPVFPLGGGGVPDSGGQSDPSLTVNPNNGKLECWYTGNDNRAACFADSPDGTTWTKHGQYLAYYSWNDSGRGEPNAYYDDNGVRFLSFDASYSVDGGPRSIGSAYSPNADTSWITNGTILGVNPVGSWDTLSVFDSNPFGIFDLGDGNGRVLWMLYAGGDNPSQVDATNSSIGLAFRRRHPERGGSFF